MKRVLVIDDEAAVREVLCLLLEDEGLEVTQARDGVDGLCAFRLFGADLVLCDMLMPGKDGLHTIRELLRDFPAVKIIAMSGGFSERLNLLPAARFMGAAACLDKPFTTGELLKVIEKTLDTPACAE